MKISLSTLLIITVIVASMIGTSIGAYFLYQQTSTEMIHVVYSNLASATEFKAEHIKTYLGGIKRETTQGASRVTFSKLLTTDKSSPDYQLALNSAQNSIEQLQKTNPYYDEVFLMGMDAKIVISSDKDKIGADKSSDLFFTSGQKEVAIREVYYSNVTGKPQLGATSPVFDSSGKVVGVYAARINPDELNDIMDDRNGLGTSGEMVLVNRQSYAITPLRYKENVVLHLFVNTSMVQDCLKDMNEYYDEKGELIGEHSDSGLIYTDYRGVKSLGAHNYVLPQAPWCVIAKIDESEALGQPLAKMLNVFIIFGVGLILFTSIVIYIISRILSRSINRLSEDVAKITKGDLNIRLVPSSIAEVQNLTDSLNRVLASLKLAVLRSGVSKEDMGIGEALFAKKKAEEKLNESENKYHLLVENSHDIIYSLSADGVFTFVSPAWTVLLGHPIDRVVGQPFQKFVHPDDIARCMVWLQKVISSGQRQDGIEYRVRHMNGTWFWHTSSATPLINETGKVIGFYGNSRDITADKKASETLRESEEKYRGLYEGASDAIMMLSPPSWNFTAGNPAAIKMFNLKDEKEFVSLSPWELSPERQPDGQLSSKKAGIMITKAMKEGHVSFEWTHRRRNGAEFFATVLLTKIVLNGKNVLQATVRDITEQKKSTYSANVSELRKEILGKFDGKHPARNRHSG